MVSYDVYAAVFDNSILYLFGFMKNDLNIKIVLEVCPIPFVMQRLISTVQDANFHVFFIVTICRSLSRFTKLVQLAAIFFFHFFIF